MKFQSDRERKRYFARRKNGTGPEVHYGAGGGALLIEFSYSPERIKALKKLGARYRPVDKRWSLSPNRIEELETTGLFPRESAVISCRATFEPTLVNDSDPTETSEINPFAVPESVLAVETPDVVIRSKGRRLALRISPRLGNNGQRIVESVPGAHFVAKDNAYWIPTQELVALVKKLRDKKLSFGVEETLSHKLKASSEERNRLLSGGELPSQWSLERCGLLPYVSLQSLDDAPRFELHGFTGEQWRQMLKLAKLRRPKGVSANVLNAQEVMNLLGASGRLKFRLWRTAEVDAWLNAERALLKENIADRTEAIADHELELAEPMAFWAIREDRGALVVRGDVREGIRNRVEPEVSLPREIAVGECNEYRMPFSDLARVYEAVTRISHYPMTTSFSTLLESARLHRSALIAARRIADLTNVDPADLIGLDIDAGNKLFPHQRVAVKWLCENVNTFLGDDMGLGKTLSVLAAYRALSSRGIVKLLLVVSPVSLVRNWQNECARWFPDLSAQIVTGQKSEKAWTLRLVSNATISPDVLILNYEACRLEYVRKALESLVDRGDTFLCLDESQRIKNPVSKTFESLLKIADRAKRRVLLSGTPAPRDMADLWSQFRVLDGGERLGRSYYRWLESVAELGTKYSDFAVKGFRAGAVEEVMARAHEVMLRRRKEEVTNLPEKLFVNRYVPLRGDQMTQYEEIREELLLRMRTSDGKQFTREITNLLEQYLRAVQVASNPRLLDPEWKGDPVKFLELDAIVDEVVVRGEGKIVVWTNYLGNVRELTERYAAHGARPFSGEVSAKERQATVSAFQNDSERKVLVAVPAAGGVGITLTAAQTAVYIDRTWNAEHWLQSIDRIHRIGQQGTVSVITMTSCRIDDLIAKNLEKKADMLAKLLGDTAEAGEATAEELGLSREEFLKAVTDVEKGE